MLSDVSVEVGVNLAKIVVSNGLTLIPKKVTLINELVCSINDNILVNGNDNFEITDSYVKNNLINGSSGKVIEKRNNKLYVSSSHDSLIDNYSIDLCNLVGNHISFIRNVVNREVNLLEENLKNRLENHKYREPEEFFNVNYFKLHDVFNSYLVQNEVVRYKDASDKFFFESMNLRKIGEDNFDLIGYVLTGDEEEDIIIKNWASSIGDSKLKGYIVNDIVEYSLSTDALLDYSLINYLFYRNLVEKNNLDLGYTSIQLRNMAASNRDYFGNKLNIALELYRKDIRNGRLLSTSSDISFSYLNSKPLNIVIYEENFEKLVEGGGSIEVLFGYIANIGSIDVTVNELLESKNTYLQKWLNIRSLYIVYLDNNRLNIFKQIAKEVFENSLNKDNMNDDEKEFLNSKYGFLEETKRLGSEYIDNLSISDIDDIDDIALELVAKIRYRFTNAYSILSHMKEILKSYNDIEPLEAASYAAIMYITNYLLDQVNVVKI